MNQTFVLLCLSLLMNPLGSQDRYPPSNWADEPNPLVSPLAEPGGRLRVFAGQYPQSFNYYLDNNSFCAELFDLMFESLLGIHQTRLDIQPALAEYVEVSDDKLNFTFHLNPRAHWSDGMPVTAEDVKWTFDAIKNPDHLTGPHKVAFDRIASPEILDEHTIRFTVGEVHWRNLMTLSGFAILPRHVFQEKDFNRANFDFPVVSGPYRIESIQEGVKVRLEKREDYWNAEAVSHQGSSNFETLEFRFYPERDVAFEAFMQGEIDLFAVYTAHRWVQQTDGEAFQKNWILKQRIRNQQPVGFQGFAMNMRRPLFADLRVRQALAHLLDRERMNETLMHNQYRLQRSYFEDLYSASHPNPNEWILFDKDRARQLLAEAGWTANPETGLLEKDGQPFVVRFLTRSSTSDKFLVIYREDLKDVGIDLVMDKKDWAAWTQDMDEYNYDMTWAAWGAGLWKDPESMWHSREASRASGNNITGFADENVDALIDQLPPMFDVEERNEIIREIDSLITQQVPYVLLWNSDSTRLLYWNRFGTPSTVLSQYGRESSAYSLWWYDAYAAQDLEDAMKEGRSLPAVAAEIDFDQVFESP